MRKTIYLIIFLIGVLLIGIYFAGQKEVEAAVIRVEITKDMPLNALNGSERNELIGDVSLNKVYVKKLAAPGASDMYMPGISVALFRNKMMVSEWTSVPIKDKGMYELRVGLNEKIDDGEVVSIAVYVNDERGEVVIGKKKDAVWG